MKITSDDIDGGEIIINRSVAICKNCKFFKPTKNCWGNCDSKIFQDVSTSFEHADGALFEYADFEGYQAEFEVHENFGCVGFEQLKPLPF